MLAWFVIVVLLVAVLALCAFVAAVLGLGDEPVRGSSLWRILRWLMTLPVAFGGSLVGLVAFWFVHDYAAHHLVQPVPLHGRWAGVVLPPGYEIPIVSAAYAAAAALFVLFGTITVPGDARVRAPLVLFLLGGYLATLALPGMGSKRGIVYAVACYGTGLVTALVLQLYLLRRGRSTSPRTPRSSAVAR